MAYTSETLVMPLSGGADSSTLLHYAAREKGFKKIHTIEFNYGQRHVRELECARYQREIVSARYKIPVVAHSIELPELQYIAELAGSALVNRDVEVPGWVEVQGDPQPATYVPFRNLIFLTYALGLAEAVGAGHVYYGAQRHDIYGYWDTTPDFVEAVDTVASLNRKNRIRVQAPFVEYSKAEVVGWGLKNQVNYGYTWSCYVGQESACGNCPTCRERQTAFIQNSEEDPIAYAERMGIPWQS